MTWPVGNRNASKCMRGLVLLAFGVLYTALYLRGLDFGHPVCEHGDEWAITEQGMTMAAQGPFHPLREYTYGSLSIFIQCGISSVLHAYNNAFGVYRDAAGNPIQKSIEAIAKNPADRDLFRFHLAGRAATACYAAGLFWMVYLCGMRLFANRPAAYLCVAAAMLNPLMMQQAHFVLPNVLATALALAAVYCGITFLDNGSKRVLYAGAAIAGLAIATKITMVWAFAVIAAVALVRWRAASIKHLPFLLLVFCGAFLLAEPYVIFDTRHFFTNFAREAHTYGQGTIMDSRDFQRGAFGSDQLRVLAAQWPLLHPLAHWFHQGSAYFLAGLAGLILLPFLTGWKGAATLLFPVLAFLFIGMQRKVLTTNYVPFIPFCALGFGATGYAMLNWPVLRKRFTQPFLTAAILAAAVPALVLPAQNCFGIARQFTTPDPYQTALKWMEANLPKQAKITSERGMLASIPFVNDGFDVRLGFFVFYTTPYTGFMDRDYVVALSPGLCDRFPWTLSMFIHRNTEPLAFESNMRIRHLNEQRLLLRRHVTPEECGYVPFAETPIVAHDVYVYQVPKVTPIRVEPPRETAGNDRPHWQVTAGSPLTTHATLPAGRYDVFLEGIKRVGSTTDPAPAAVYIDDQAGIRVYFFDTDHNDHFVSTITVDTPKEVRFQIRLDPVPHTTPQNVWVYSLMCVPAPAGEDIPAIPLAETRNAPIGPVTGPPAEKRAP